jgi:hypothetical protein
MIFYFLVIYADKLWKENCSFKLDDLQSYTILWKALIINSLNNLIDLWLIEILNFFESGNEIKNTKKIPLNKKKFSEFSLIVKFNFLNN